MTSSKQLNSVVLKKTIGIIFVVVLLLAAQPFLWRYVFSSARMLHNVRTVDAQLVILQERLEEIDVITKEQQSLFDQLSVIFPDNSSIPQLIARLEQVGDRQGVVVEVQGIGENDNESMKERINQFTITVRALGPIDKLLAYMDAIEHVQELTSIDAWSLDPRAVVETGEGNAPLMPQYELTARVIFYLQASDD